jgi:hypothetical protein
VKIPQFKTTLLAFVILICCSWGFLAHKTIHQLAIYSLPKGLQGFFFQNMEYLVYNSVRPDVRRKDDPSEATKHFIDIDAKSLGENAANTMPSDWTAAGKKYSIDTLRKYGTVPFEIMFLKEKLTRAFRNNLKDSILYYAADLGHYVADAHVPLHTTINYDGQLSGQTGLHSLWESTVPEMNISQYNLYGKTKAKYLKNPSQRIWEVIRKSHQMLPYVLEAEIRASEGFTEERKFKRSERMGVTRKNFSGEFAKVYAEKLGETVNTRIMESVQCVADFWYTSWVDAGCPDLSELNDNQKVELKKQLNSWKENTLIKDGLLSASQKKNNE